MTYIIIGNYKFYPPLPIAVAPTLKKAEEYLRGQGYWKTTIPPNAGQFINAEGDSGSYCIIETILEV